MASLIKRGARRIRGRLAMSVGQVASLTPLSEEFGFDRGKPVDRFYIERFLQQNATAVRGRVLEVADDGYSRRYGSGQISRQDVLDLDRANPKATIVGDLTLPDVLPGEAFDCVILTQTLHHIFDIAAAIEQVRRSLNRGGVALITVPGITPVDPAGWNDSWYWSLSGPALERLLHRSFDPSNVSVSVYGNLYAATAFLHGAAVQELSRRKLERVDPAYPVTVAARAVA